MQDYKKHYLTCSKYALRTRARSRASSLDSEYILPDITASQDYTSLITKCVIKIQT